jgi:hypothetical protein
LAFLINQRHQQSSTAISTQVVTRDVLLLEVCLAAAALVVLAQIAVRIGTAGAPVHSSSSSSSTRAGVQSVLRACLSCSGGSRCACTDHSWRLHSQSSCAQQQQQQQQVKRRCIVNNIGMTLSPIGKTRHTCA